MRVRFLNISNLFVLCVYIFSFCFLYGQESLEKFGMTEPPSGVVSTIREDIKKKEYDLALGKLAQPLRLFPKYGELKVLKAICLYHKLKFEESLQLLKEAKELGYDNADLYRYLGDNFESVTKDDLALDAYKESIKREDTVYVNICMSNLYKIQLNFDEALSCIKNAIKLTPDDISLYAYLAGYYLDIQDYDKAKENFSRALKATNSEYYFQGLYKFKNHLFVMNMTFHEYIYWGFSKVEYEKGNYKDSLNYILKGLDIKRKSEALYLLMSLVFYSVNDFVNAEKAILQSLKYFPDSFISLTQASEFYNLRGNYVEAEKYALRLVKKSPMPKNFELLKEIQMNLKNSNTLVKP